MSKTKLTYFPIRGRAEAIRVALEAAGVDYESVVADWPAMKPTLPFGQVPVFQDDQVTIVQSMAILRHVGRRYNLYGANDVERAHVDVVVDSFGDLLTTVFKAIFDPAFQGDKKEEYAKSVAGWLTNLENYLKKNAGGSGFFVGASFTIADAAAFHVLDNYVKPLWTDILNSHAVLEAYRQRIAAHERIAAYLASDRRPAVTLPPAYTPFLSSPEACK